MKRRYKLLSFAHVCALETSDDGDVDCLVGDCIDETLGNGVTADDTT
jgi:hypothetical protein